MVVPTTPTTPTTAPSNPNKMLDDDTAVVGVVVNVLGLVVVAVLLILPSVAEVSRWILQEPYNCTARAFARAAYRWILQSPRAVSSAQRLPHSCQPIMISLHCASLYHARASGSEAELRIVVDYYGAAGDGVNVGQVDTAAGGNDGGGNW